MAAVPRRTHYSPQQRSLVPAKRPPCSAGGSRTAAACDTHSHADTAGSTSITAPLIEHKYCEWRNRSIPGVMKIPDSAGFAPPLEGRTRVGTGRGRYRELVRHCQTDLIPARQALLVFRGVGLFRNRR